MFVWLAYFLVFWLGLYAIFSWLMFEGYVDLEFLHWGLMKFHLLANVDFFFVVWFPFFLIVEALVILSRTWTNKTYTSYWDLSWDHALKGRRGNLCTAFSTDALVDDTEKHLPDTTIVMACYVDAEDSILEKVLAWYFKVFPKTPFILSCNCKNNDKYLGWITSLQEAYSDNPLIHIIINPESRSKPANLNAAVPLVKTKYMYICDCGVFPDGTITDHVHLIESGKFTALQGIKIYSSAKSESLYAAWVAHNNTLSMYTFHRFTSEFLSSGFFIGSNVLLETSTAASIPWEDCIADDQLYLIKLNYHGHKAVQVPAFAIEDAPETTNNAFKQQFRWYRANFLLTFRREFWATRKVFPTNIVWSFGPWVAIFLYFGVMCGKTLQWILLIKHFTVEKLLTVISLEVLIVFGDLLLNFTIALRPMCLQSFGHHALFALKTLPFDIVAHQCWIFFFLVYSALSNLSPSLRTTWHSSGVKRDTKHSDARSFAVASNGLATSASTISDDSTNLGSTDLAHDVQV